MSDYNDPHFDEPADEDRLHQEAEDLMRQGRYQDAVRRYADLRRLVPTDPWAKLGYASALECNGQITEAAQVLEDASTHDRSNRHVMRFCALFYQRREDKFHAQRFQEVLQSFEPIFDDDPGDQLAEMYFNQGRYHEANAELQRILREEAPDDHMMRASVLARVGACLRQNDELEEARSHLRLALDLDATNHWILSELAETERGLDEYESARRYYQEALQLEEQDIWSRARLANLEYEDGNTDQAIALYEQVLEQEPQAIWARVELAQVLTDIDAAHSERLCREAIDQDPTYPWAYAQLAQLARWHGRFEDARTLFQQALSHSPQSLWIMHELADSCRQLGRFQEARTHLEHARNVAPFDPVTHGFYADLLRGEGRNEEAIAYLIKAVELDGTYTWAWRELCELYAITGDHDRAQAAYAQVLELEPGEAINDGLKAFLLRFQDKRDAAVPFLESALVKMPDYFWAWRELCDYHLRRGDFPEAETIARQGLQQLPDNTTLLTMLAESLRQQHKRKEALAVVQQGLHGDSQIAQLWAMKAELVLPDNRAEALQAAYKSCDFSDSPEYRVLLAQCLIVCGKNDKARDLLGLLCNEEPVSPVPFELAAEFSEQDGDKRRALALSDRGLEHFPESIRLRIRQTRLRLDLGYDDALENLTPLIDHPGDLPWHEITPLFARGGDMTAVRRAAYRHINQCGDDRESAARAWLVLAESLLLNHQQTEAREALRTSLALKPDLVPARLLATMLADQEGEYDRALEHILEVKHLLDAAEDDHDKPLEQAALLQQIANLTERAGKLEEARQHWQHLQERYGHRPEIRLELHGFQLRSGQEEDGLKGLEQLLEEHQPQSALFQRALYQLCLLLVQRQRAAQALERLLAYRSQLQTANLLLAAQCALLCEQFDRCDVLLDSLHDDDRESRELAERMRVRCLLGRGRTEQALVTSKELFAADPSDEACAQILAEVLIQHGDYRQALRVLTMHSLPQAAGLDRVLLATCLYLELDGEVAAFTWLGAHRDVANADHGLARLFASAWPKAWGRTLPAAGIKDVANVPLLLTCAERIAAGLRENGRDDVAGALWLHLAAEALQDDRPYSHRICCRRSVAHLLRDGQRKRAFSAAWRGRSPLLWLRCTLP
ncbi:MAG: tetratricopeptide repeat protein [Planctomycetota bacterium]